MSAKMNNFSAPTTTETLPKSGHVNEVCKEWLVREDGALAYKLQSQEINDFYKGNRTRNAVVREDFPTALQEQIKEKETADKQAEAYRRRLREQEEHDKRVAKEIAEKLERDLHEQRVRELKESEKMAQQMQEIYVNLPPVPPPSARDANKVPPPRPAKSSTLQQQHQNHQHHQQQSLQQQQQHHHHHQQQQHQQPLSPNGYRNPHSPQYPIQLQQHHFSNTDNYVGLALHATPAQQRQQQQQAQRSPTNTGQFVKLSPEKYDQLIGNKGVQYTQVAAAAKERHIQEHADDIELYVDPCDYASLKEIGLPMREIKEMSAKMKQEQKDELLARRLQELEVTDGMTLEERDRMMAIEAQDKELARMLQEREKAKAKRAKEKARQRKSQQKELPAAASGIPQNGHLSQPQQQQMPQDLMSSSMGAMRNNRSSPSEIAYLRENSQQQQQEELLDLDAYSSPIDVIKHTQRTQNGCLTNGSLTRDLASQQARHASLAREDDIYTLPVDSCRPGQVAAQSNGANGRPASMAVAADSGGLITVGSVGYSQNSMTRSENFSIHSHDSLNSRNSATSKIQAFDQNSSPTPPYMPIQGTRRSNSSEDRKKKSKDNKCTHQ